MITPTIPLNLMVVSGIIFSVVFVWRAIFKPIPKNKYRETIYVKSNH